MHDRIRNSVIIPYHNGHDTIVQTLNSVLRQNRYDTEIIIIDDRSDLYSRMRLEEAVSARPNVLVVNADGAGPSAARNSGVAFAAGDLLFFLDADDCMADGSIGRYRRLFDEDRTLGVAFGRVRITPEPEKAPGVITAWCPSPDLAEVIGENPACTTSNYVARADAFRDIGPFNRALERAEDQEWLARAVLDPRWGVRGIDAVTLEYRTSPHGLSADLHGMLDGWTRMVDSIEARHPGLDRKTLGRARGLFLRYLARRALRLGRNRSLAARLMVAAFRAWPGLMLRDIRRTWPTAIGAGLVCLAGPAPFRKFFA